jgi:chitinase
MVGYLEDWVKVPSSSVLSHYSHVMYAFVESTSSSCTLTTPTKSYISAAHSAGAKVLASVGGASMDKYWKNCNVDNLVNQLVSMVNEYGFDGIDIDYEVDPPNESFVVSLNNKLRDKLPSGKLLTHAPENNMMVKGGSYWNILKQCKGVDFIAVQYYNDEPAPTSSESKTLSHYDAIVNELFGGDATKVVFGYCISDCGSYNMKADKASAFTKKIYSKYGSSFGGAMNWAINQGDNDGSWSSAVKSAMN